MLQQPQRGFLSGYKTHIIAVLSLISIWSAFALDIPVHDQQPLDLAEAVSASVLLLFAMTFRSALRTESTNVFIQEQVVGGDPHQLEMFEDLPELRKTHEAAISKSASRIGPGLVILLFLSLGCCPTQPGYINANDLDPAFSDTLDRFEELLANTDYYSEEEEYAYGITAKGLRLTLEMAKQGSAVP